MLRRSLLLAFAGLSLPAYACTSSSALPLGVGGNDAGTPVTDGGTPVTDGGTPRTDGGAPVALTVTPSTGAVLTCDTLPLTASGGPAGTGAWSAAGVGSVSDGGLYAAPTSIADAGVVDGGGAATVTYAVGGASASAQLQIATAFVGTPAVVPIAGNGSAFPIKPYEATFSASGSSVYAGVPGANNVEADVFASTDNGKTFTGPTAYHTGWLSCAVSAADPTAPSTVYLAYLAGHGDTDTNTGGTLRLAVSSDGASTFPVEYVLVDSDNTLPSFICPDIAAPSAGHVIVAGDATNSAATQSWIATFQSSSSGSAIGPVGQQGMFTDAGATGTFLSSTDTNSASATACAIVADGSGGSPRIYSNTSGTACIVFQHITDPSCGALSGAVMVQCSADNGATWTTPASVATGTVSNTAPVGAVSPGGNVAVVYTQEVATIGETFLVISKDGGHTWGTPVQYPSGSPVAIDGAGGSLFTQALRWEGDGILWMSATVSNDGTGSFVYVDKTCDFGATWSGAVAAVGGYGAAGIVATASGMAVGAGLPNNASGGPALELVPLYP
jgi:hypothetical protein